MLNFTIKTPTEVVFGRGIEEKIGERINIKRVRMAVATNADQLLSNCPFCLTMFEDGVKGADVEEKLRPRDIAEVLADRL